MKGRGHSFFLLRVRWKWGWQGQKVSWGSCGLVSFSAALSVCQLRVGPPGWGHAALAAGHNVLLRPA